MCQVFIFLLGHLHFFVHFFFTFMENLFMVHPIFSNIFTLRCDIFSFWPIPLQNYFLCIKLNIFRSFWPHLALFSKKVHCKLPQMPTCVKMRISEKFVNLESVHACWFAQGKRVPSIIFHPIIFPFGSYVCLSTVLSVRLSVYLSVCPVCLSVCLCPDLFINGFFFCRHGSVFARAFV